MADINVQTMIVPVPGGGTAEITEKFIDQGDGTYARKMAVEIVLGDVTIGEVDQGAAGAEAWPVSGPLTDTQLRDAPVETKDPTISVAAAISGQINITTPGTSIQGGNVALTNGVYIKALVANTGKMYIGYATGDNRTGFELTADQLIIVNVSNLNQLWFDASVGNEKICWLKA